MRRCCCSVGAALRLRSVSLPCEFPVSGVDARSCVSSVGRSVHSSFSFTLLDSDDVLWVQGIDLQHSKPFCSICPRLTPKFDCFGHVEVDVTPTVRLHGL